MTTFDEAECLKTNPFEGDFGSPGDKVLKDKIGTARKGGTCGMCRQEIVPGERVRLLAAVFDGHADELPMVLGMLRSDGGKLD